MLISIIIPTKNRCKLLKRLINTILTDEYDQKQIIIIDGASTDGTVDYLKEIDESIYYWVSEPDQGEYDALNKGLKIATGEILKFMTDDDLLVPGVFTYAADYFDKNSKVDVLFGRSIIYYGNGNVLRDDREDINLYKSLNFKSIIRKQRQMPKSITSFIRKTVLDDLDGFSTNFFSGDMDLWLRIFKRGYNIHLSKRLFAKYYRTEISGVVKYKKTIKKEAIQLAEIHGNRFDVINAYLNLNVFPKIIKSLYLIRGIFYK